MIDEDAASDSWLGRKDSSYESWDQCCDDAAYYDGWDEAGYAEASGPSHGDGSDYEERLQDLHHAKALAAASTRTLGEARKAASSARQARSSTAARRAASRSVKARAEGDAATTTARQATGS